MIHTLKSTAETSVTRLYKKMRENERCQRANYYKDNGKKAKERKKTVAKVKL